jgi:hypothetical protein
MAFAVHALNIGIIVTLLSGISSSTTLTHTDHTAGNQPGSGTYRRTAASAQSRPGSGAHRGTRHGAANLAIGGSLIGAAANTSRGILSAGIIILLKLFKRHT